MKNNGTKNDVGNDYELVNYVAVSKWKNLAKLNCPKWSHLLVAYSKRILTGEVRSNASKGKKERL